MVDIYVAISVSVEGRFAPSEGISLPINATEDPQLFEKATQAHTKAVESAFQGEELAMAFCRGVVEAHGGRIRRDFDVQNGRLTPTFTLPSVGEGILSPELRGIVGEPLPVPQRGLRSSSQLKTPDCLAQFEKYCLARATAP